MPMFNQSPVSGADVPRLRCPSPFFGGESLSVSQMQRIDGDAIVTREPGPDGRVALKVAFTTSSNMRFDGAAGTHFFGDAYVQLHGGKNTGLGYLAFYHSMTDSSYANGGVQVIDLTPGKDVYHGQGGAETYWFRKSRHTQFGNPTYPGYLGSCRLKFEPVTPGQQSVVYIYGIGFSTKPKKGRVFMTIDDGYDTFFQNGFEILRSRGIKSTLAVIPTAQDFGSGYSYWRQIEAYVQAGNAVVAHGPMPAQGAGNLWTAYGGTGAPDAVQRAVDDMIAARAALSARGLLMPGAEKCYVWPQGIFQRVAGDTGLLDAALASGFTVARSTSTIQLSSIYNSGLNFDALAKYQQLALPIIGHAWAGSTAAEATNVAAIVASINRVAADCGDICVMLHRVQPSNTPDASMSAIGIRASDLDAICAAIEAQVSAGSIECALLPDLARRTWWGA